MVPAMVDVLGLHDARRVVLSGLRSSAGLAPPDAGKATCANCGGTDKGARRKSSATDGNKGSGRIRKPRQERVFGKYEPRTSNTAELDSRVHAAHAPKSRGAGRKTPKTDYDPVKRGTPA